MAVYSAAARSLAQDIPNIVKAYKAGLRDLRSPLALRAEAWTTCRYQAESIVSDCAAALNGVPPTHHIEIKRYSRTLGVDRAEQRIGVSESIRAVEVLWAAMQTSVRAAASRESESERVQVLLVITTAFRSSAMSRLYAAAVGYDAAVGLAAASAPARGRGVADSPLTRRERDVLAGVGRALSNAQIAQELGITESTVKRHLQNIYAKLGAVSRIDAVNKGSSSRRLATSDLPTD